MPKNLVIGVDFGTDSVRAVLVDTSDGREISSAAFTYPRWKAGRFCDPAKNQFRQHPLDYTEALQAVVTECLAKAGEGAAADVRAISVDTTGSTPVAVDQAGLPLALLSEFSENPNAMFVLWKDHTAIKEADEINRFAATQNIYYLKDVGGIYSSEWYWAKALHILREDEAVREACYIWVEHCDWITFLLTGGTHADQLKRSRCAAGHKALWSAELNGFPPAHWFDQIDPMLTPQVMRLPAETYTADQAAGTLCPEWAAKLGLSTEVIIGCGAFDAHMGAVGGQIEPYYLSKVMGTSTCDMLVTPKRETKTVAGICGQVHGSVIPGMTGYEAGQSAFGDTYAWLRNLLLWPLEHLPVHTFLRDALIDQVIPELSKQATELPLDENAELAIDWLNGRRTPDANQNMKGALTNLHLASDASRLFRALAESTCFGAKAIIERFEQQGIAIKGMIGIGGVARKSPYIMQMMADVCGLPIRIHRHEQTCAHGAAMFAATAAGIFPNVEVAMQTMGGGFDQAYEPNAANSKYYEARYQKYLSLGRFLEGGTHE